MSTNPNNTKMKGLLKGLRYISQIFDNEKEPEMQIGFPTDVKHVAHIGWDGPSVNSPSWMTEFKSPPSFASGPLSLSGERKDDLDAPRRSGRMSNPTIRDLPELPKASRRHSTSKNGDGASGVADSPTRGKSDKARHRRSSKNTINRDGTNSPRQSRRSMDSNLGADSPARNLTEIPKKNRRKKSKDSNLAGGGSSRSRPKGINSPKDQFLSPFSDPGPGTLEKDSDLNCQKPPIFDEGDEIKELIT